MVTDRYQHVLHHPEVADFLGEMARRDIVVIGVDNVEGSVPIESVGLPERCVLVFGQEGPGLSPAMLAGAEQVVSITQFGSTRSVNVGVAAGIAMHRWVVEHAIDRSGGT